MWRPEPLFGLVDWREREWAADRTESRGGLEEGLLGLEADMDGMGSGTYQAARFEPTKRVGEEARQSTIAEKHSQSHSGSPRAQGRSKPRWEGVDRVQVVSEYAGVFRARLRYSHLLMWMSVRAKPSEG